MSQNPIVTIPPPPIELDPAVDHERTERLKREANAIHEDVLKIAARINALANSLQKPSQK